MQEIGPKEQPDRWVLIHRDGQILHHYQVDEDDITTVRGATLHIGTKQSCEQQMEKLKLVDLRRL